MKRGNHWITRSAALALALTLLASAVGAGAAALGDPPARHIALAMEPGVPALEPLAVGGVLVEGDVLRLDVAADADFAVYSNSTVIYYDSRYFTPVQGGGTGDYFDLDEDNPLCEAGEAFEDANAGHLADGPYAAATLNVPYDLTGRPAAGTPTADMPWFSLYLKATGATPTGETASIFLSPDTLRTAENRNAPMYYSAAPGGAGWLNVDVTLPARLEYAIEVAADNPVTVSFAAGAHGSLTGGIAYVRNIEAGTHTLLSAQQALRWPGTQADFGYYFKGWADAGDPLNALPPNTLLEADATLVPVFLPNPVTVQLYVLDLSRPAGSQEVDLGAPLDLCVGYGYSGEVAALAPVIGGYPVDTGGGWFLEALSKTYVVPEMDAATLRVEVARVHRGTWFVTYQPGGADVTGMPSPDRQEKPRGVTVAVAAAPKRRNYTFRYWTDGTGSYAPGQSYSADADLALTAVWEGPHPAPSVEGGASRALQYKDGATLRLITSGPGPVTWSSSNPGVVSVDTNTGAIRGAGRGTATVTGRDGDGFTAGVTVTVSYAWWQWLIVIFLFGWLWY